MAVGPAEKRSSRSTNVSKKTQEREPISVIKYRAQPEHIIGNINDPIGEIDRIIELVPAACTHYKHGVNVDLMCKSCKHVDTSYRDLVIEKQTIFELKFDLSDTSKVQSCLAKLFHNNMKTMEKHVLEMPAPTLASAPEPRNYNSQCALCGSTETKEAYANFEINERLLISTNVKVYAQPVGSKLETLKYYKPQLNNLTSIVVPIINCQGLAESEIFYLTAFVERHPNHFTSGIVFINPQNQDNLDVISYNTLEERVHQQPFNETSYDYHMLVYGRKFNSATKEVNLITLFFLFY